MCRLSNQVPGRLHRLWRRPNTIRVPGHRPLPIGDRRHHFDEVFTQWTWINRAGAGGFAFAKYCISGQCNPQRPRSDQVFTMQHIGDDHGVADVIGVAWARAAGEASRAVKMNRT